MPSSLRVLRHRDYALVQLGNAVSSLGTWMQYVGLGWAVRELSSWPFAISFGFVAQFGPSLVLSPFSGVLADRIDRRLTTMVGNFAMAIPPLVIAWLIHVDAVTIPRLLGVVAIGGAAQAMVHPASQAIVPALVPAAELGEAIGLSVTLSNLTRIAGPSIAAFAIHRWGVGGAFFGNGLSFLAVVIAWWFVRPANTKPTAEAQAEPYFTRLRLGFVYSRRDRVIFPLLIVTTVLSLFVYHSALLPAYVRDVLHAKVGTYSLLTSAAGFGAVVGAVIASELKSPRARNAAMRIGALVAATSIFVLSFSRSAHLSTVCLVSFGFGYFLFGATSMTVILVRVPDDYRGRVMGLIATAAVGGIPIAALVAGVLGSWIGITPTIGLGGAVMVAGVLWWIVAVRDPSGEKSLSTNAEPAPGTD